jgi:hypothetical protein
MVFTYYISLTKHTYVKTYFAEISGSDPKYGFKRTFLKADTSDSEKERGYYHTIWTAGVFEQSIKVFSLETRKLIRREIKYFIYDEHCLHEIERREVLDLLKKIRELAAL